MLLRPPCRLLCSVLLAAPLANAQGGAQSSYHRDQGGWVRRGPDGEFRVNPEVVSARAKDRNRSWDSVRAALAPRVRAGEEALLRLSHLRTNLLGIHDLRVAEGDDVLEVVRLLRASGLFEFAEENTLGAYLASSNDPAFGQQWALRNTGQTGGTPGADVDAKGAWSITTGAPSIVVGVLDSGTEVAHPDLAPNVWTNPGEIPGNGIDDDGNGFVDDFFGWDFVNNNSDVTGPFDHGTSVTGIIGARTGNALGIAGLAGGNGASAGARTMAVGVGDFFPDAAILDDAILYALAQGARVVTMSLTVGQSSAIDAALDYAWNQQDVFVDCAAGNSGGAVGYPASNANVVSCAASDSTDNRPSWSSTGPQNWIAAPGVDVHTTSTGGGYTTTSGTSFSAPHVAAAAALVYSVLPSTSNASVKEILRLSADDILQPGFDNGSGWGRLDAGAAVLLASQSDCNQNGVFDPEDIASGSSTDANGDGTPDECQCLGSPASYCIGAPNSLGAGASLGFSGSWSVAQNDFVLSVVSAAASRPGLFYYGTTAVQIPFGNGWRCVGGQTFRLPIVWTDAFGDASFALDLANPPQPAGRIDAGETWNFQFWYRDPLGGGANFNLSNALAVPFCP